MIIRGTYVEDLEPIGKASSSVIVRVVLIYPFTTFHLSVTMFTKVGVHLSQAEFQTMHLLAEEHEYDGNTYLVVKYSCLRVSSSSSPGIPSRRKILLSCVRAAIASRK